MPPNNGGMLTIRRDVCIVSRFVVVGLLAMACRTAPPVSQAPGAAAIAAAPAAPATPRIGFRTEALLDRHFAKHGAEFEGYGRADYLAAAQRLRDTVVGGDILEVKRPDGTSSRFDRGSGAFVAFDPDGTIRTFFRPNDGEAYFRRQARRRQE